MNTISGFKVGDWVEWAYSYQPFRVSVVSPHEVVAENPYVKPLVVPARHIDLLKVVDGPQERPNVGRWSPKPITIIWLLSGKCRQVMEEDIAIVGTIPFDGGQQVVGVLPDGTVLARAYNGNWAETTRWGEAARR